MTPSEQLIGRVMKHACQCGDCLLWKGAMATAGETPSIWWDGKAQPVRRVLWAAMGRRFIAGLAVGVTCNEPKCVAPEHLVQRRPRRLKELHPITRAKVSASARRLRSSLTEEAVQEIRLSDEPRKVIAARHSISVKSVEDIQKMRRWAPMTSPFLGLGSRGARHA